MGSKMNRYSHSKSVAKRQPKPVRSMIIYLLLGLWICSLPLCLCLWLMSPVIDISRTFVDICSAIVGAGIPCPNPTELPLLGSILAVVLYSPPIISSFLITVSCLLCISSPFTGMLLFGGILSRSSSKSPIAPRSGDVRNPWG
jgi:hypothetical protein